MKDDCPVMVSVRCATYNHAPFIRQCLDGFVMQKTSFQFEVIVHDDCSTDGTADIVREYAEKYPAIIKPMFETENQYSKDVAAMNDSINDLLIGKYVALCEGDDYWTDPLKLQKQFDYMESHPNCSLCFHANYRHYSDDKIITHTPKILKDIYGAKEVILLGGGMMATNSMFFHRKNYLWSSERPPFWKNAPVGDVPLALYLSCVGDIGYINEYMCSYRIESNNSWTKKTRLSFKTLTLGKKMSMMLCEFDNFTGKKYHKYVIIGRLLYLLRSYRDLLLYFRYKILKNM